MSIKCMRESTNAGVPFTCVHSAVPQSPAPAPAPSEEMIVHQVCSPTDCKHIKCIDSCLERVNGICKCEKTANTSEKLVVDQDCPPTDCITH